MAGSRRGRREPLSVIENERDGIGVHRDRNVRSSFIRTAHAEVAPWVFDGRNLDHFAR
jgi:hypothetical protein